MKKILLFIFLFVVFFNQIFALDTQQFEFLRPIVVRDDNNVKSQKNFNLVIDDLIYRHSKGQFLSDLRVIDENKKEIFFNLYKENSKTKVEINEKKISIVKIEKNKKSISYILDFGEQVKYHNKLKIDTSSPYFSRFYQVYSSGSLDGEYEKINLFDFKKNKIFKKPTQKNFLINYKFTNKRFLKIVLTGAEGELKINKFVFFDVKKTNKKGRTKEYDVEILNKVFYDDKMEFLLKMPNKNIPIDYLTFLIKNNNFSSQIEIFSSNNEKSKFSDKTQELKEGVSYWKKIYQGDFSREVYIDDIKLNINDNKQYYFVVIKNKKKQKKIDLIAVKAGRFIESIFLRNLDFSTNKYYLLYGNQFVFKPKYVQAPNSFTIEDKKIINLKSLDEIKNPEFNNKKKIKISLTQKILISFIIFFLLLFLWFVYKNYNENKNRDIDDVDYIEKI